MPHYRIDPMKELESLSQRMKRFVEEFPESFSFEIGKAFEPKIDVLHDESTVYVNIEAPGVKKEDISLSVKDDMLTVTGSKKIDIDLEKVTPSKMERSFGEFARKIQLPCDVDASSFNANLRDGVLCITVAKLHPIPEKEITIEIQ
jgi:HSP20 family protein